MKRMKREIYVAPSTVRRSVRVESGFASSVEVSQTQAVETNGHEIVDIDGSDITNNPWNDGVWE